MFLFLWQMHTWEPCATSVPLRPIALALALAPYPHSVQIHPINCEKKAVWRLKRYLFNYNFKWEKNIKSPQNKFFNLCNFNPCNISAFGTSLTKYFFLKKKVITKFTQPIQKHFWYLLFLKVCLFPRKKPNNTPKHYARDEDYAKCKSRVWHDACTHYSRSRVRNTSLVVTEC